MRTISWDRGWLAALLLSWILASTLPAQARTAVIVNSKNPVASLTTAELKRIYLGDLRRWDAVSGAKEPVELVDYKGERERVAEFYQATTGMSVIRLRTQWIGMVFRGEMPQLPASVKTEEEMIAHVAAHPGAIGFVDSAFLDRLPAQVKVLKVGAKLPGDEGYPLP